MRCENLLWFQITYCRSLVVMLHLCQYYREKKQSYAIWDAVTLVDGILSTIVENKHLTVHEKHHSTAPSAVCQNSTHLCARTLCWFSSHLASILLTTYSLIWNTVFWPIRGRGCRALPYDGPPLPSRNQSQNYLFSGWLCCCGFLDAAKASKYDVWLDLCFSHLVLNMSNSSSSW